MLDISDGNRLDIFALQQVDGWTGELRSLKSLKGKHGNYTLIVRAQDMGTPSHLVEAPVHICITDYNDHAPVFISPPHNSTLRVPEVHFTYLSEGVLPLSHFNRVYRTQQLEVLWCKSLRPTKMLDQMEPLDIV